MRDLESEKNQYTGVSPKQVRFDVPPALSADDSVSEKPGRSPYKLPAIFYVAMWMGLSTGIVLYNKHILYTKGFKYPIILTSGHMIFSTIMTQLMSATSLLRKSDVKMTPRIYCQAILPIGAAFSGSIICSNFAYLYLSVAFLQMLKATMPIAVLFLGWIFMIEKFSWDVLASVCCIATGVAIASLGELRFNMIGFMLQIGAICFGATKLVMVQRLLCGTAHKMDPLTSLYWFSPICAILSLFAGLVWEIPHIRLMDIQAIGFANLLANAGLAFALNVSEVFLIGKTSSLSATLYGVLKSILIVAAAIIFKGLSISPLQYIGYVLTLCALVHHQLGTKVLILHCTEASHMWNKEISQRPTLRRILVLSSLMIIVVIVGFVMHVWGKDLAAGAIGVAAEAGEMIR